MTNFALPNTFAQVIRGENSLGALTQNLGWKSIPSPAFPRPDDEPFNAGLGYTMGTHGSQI